MGSLSMTASDLHTKCHRPPERSSDLLGVTVCTSWLSREQASPIGGIKNHTVLSLSEQTIPVPCNQVIDQVPQRARHHPKNRCQFPRKA
jgi:hypothetical protein